MAKKKGRGKGKGARRGAVKTSELGERIGAKGQATARELQTEYSADVLMFAARTIPKIPAKVARVLDTMPKADQEKFRKAFLQDALTNKVPF